MIDGRRSEGGDVHESLLIQTRVGIEVIEYGLLERGLDVVQDVEDVVFAWSAGPCPEFMYNPSP